MRFRIPKIPITPIVSVILIVTLVALAQMPIFQKKTSYAEAGPIMLLVLVLVLIGVTAVFINFYEYRGFGSQEGIIRRGSRKGNKALSLTFDDGPNPEYTPKILDVLKQYDVKASFFITGEMVKRYPELVKRIADEGHDIGNHSHSHFNMILLDDKQLDDEIDQAEQAIISVIGRKPDLFRPPRGLYSERVRQRIIDRGYYIVLWNLSAVDWGPLGKKGITFITTRFARRGSIILLHDGGSLIRGHGGNRQGTVEALSKIIQIVKIRGYELIPVSEVLVRLQEDSCLDKVS